MLAAPGPRANRPARRRLPSDRPQKTRAPRCRARAANSFASRLLPIPGSPAMRKRSSSTRARVLEPGLELLQLALAPYEDVFSHDDTTRGTGPAVFYLAGTPGARPGLRRSEASPLLTSSQVVVRARERQPRVASKVLGRAGRALLRGMSAPSARCESAKTFRQTEACLDAYPATSVQVPAVGDTFSSYSPASSNTRRSRCVRVLHGL